MYIGTIVFGRPGKIPFTSRIWYEAYDVYARKVPGTPAGVTIYRAYLKPRTPLFGHPRHYIPLRYREEYVEAHSIEELKNKIKAIYGENFLPA